MSQENLPGCRISGSGTASGGVYNEVLISGSGRIEDSVKANDIRISGSGKFSGDVETGELRVSGSAECGGLLQREESMFPAPSISRPTPTARY